LEECPDIKEHIWLRTNHGKGAALREGFAQSDGSIVCFIDADGDLDPSVLPSMVRQIKQQKFDIVYGSKLHALSNVEMSRLRRMISSGFRLLVKLLFRFDVSDTQTGVKVFSGSLIREALPLASENGFNIDLELFVVAHALGYQRFGSHPIILHRKGESSVGLTTVFQMLFSTLRLFRRRTLTLDYVPVGKVL
jgi:glycosyltransferase involved in cell wall biosynthesis